MGHGRDRANTHAYMPRVVRRLLQKKSIMLWMTAGSLHSTMIKNSIPPLVSPVGRQLHHKMSERAYIACKILW